MAYFPLARAFLALTYFLERRWGEVVRKTEARVVGPGGGFAKATGSNAGAENGPAPPPGSADPPQWRIVSGASGPVHATFGPLSRPARGRGAQEKGRRPRRGEMRARRAR
jgi:hypothetical protein